MICLQRFLQRVELLLRRILHRRRLHRFVEGARRVVPPALPLLHLFQLDLHRLDLIFLHASHLGRHDDRLEIVSVGVERRRRRRHRRAHQLVEALLAIVLRLRAEEGRAARWGA